MRRHGRLYTDTKLQNRRLSTGCGQISHKPATAECLTDEGLRLSCPGLPKGHGQPTRPRRQEEEGYLSSGPEIKQSFQKSDREIIQSTVSVGSFFVVFVFGLLGNVGLFLRQQGGPRLPRGLGQTWADVGRLGRPARVVGALYFQFGLLLCRPLSPPCSPRSCLYGSVVFFALRYNGVDGSPCRSLSLTTESEGTACMVLGAMALTGQRTPAWRSPTWSDVCSKISNIHFSDWSDWITYADNPITTGEEE